MDSASWRRSGTATLQGPAPSARGVGGRVVLLLVDRFEQLVDLLGRAGGEQLVDLVGVGEDDRDLAEDLQVAVVHPGDADREPHLVAVPVDRRVVAHHRQGRGLDGVLGLVGAVRDGEVVAHVGRHRLLPLEHRVDIRGGDRPGVDQDLPGLADRGVLAAGGSRHLDLGQGQDVAHRAVIPLGRGAAGRDRSAGPGRPGRVQRAEVGSDALVAFSSATIASYCGLLRKLSTDTCWADGDMVCARGVRSRCVTMRSTSSVRLAIATFLTSTSPNPAFLILLRSTEAPIALDPMPASQANTMWWTGLAAVSWWASSVVPWWCSPAASSASSTASSWAVSAPATELFFPFIASISAVASARSTVLLRLSLSSSEQMMKDVAQASTTDRMTPTKLPRGVCASTAMIEPGAAGARRPASNSARVPMPTMPPAIVPSSRIGFISTYGK